MNKENCALKLVDEIILYYDARSKKTSKCYLYFVRESVKRHFPIKKVPADNITVRREQHIARNYGLSRPGPEEVQEHNQLSRYINIQIHLQQLGFNYLRCGYVGQFPCVWVFLQQIIQKIHVCCAVKYWFCFSCFHDTSSKLPMSLWNDLIYTVLINPWKKYLKYLSLNKVCYLRNSSLCVLATSSIFPSKCSISFSSFLET